MRRLFLVLMVLFTVPIIVVAQSGGVDKAKVEADKLYNEGNSLLKSGKYAEAASKYDEAIALNSDDFKYHYQKGLALKKNKKLEDAIEAFETSIVLKGDFYQGYYAMGGTLHAMKKYDRAISSFRNCLQIRVNFDKARFGLAASYTGEAKDMLARGLVDTAITDLHNAVNVQKDYSPAYALLARSLNLAGRHQGAVAAALDAIKYKKKGRKGAEYFELGIAHKQLGNVAKARKAFLQARRDPNYARNAQYELDGLR